MIKKYRRKSLNQAVAAACLSLTVAAGFGAAPATAADILVGAGQTESNIVLNTDDNLTVAEGGTVAGNPPVSVSPGATAGRVDNAGTISGYYGGLVVGAGSAISGDVNNSGTISGFYGDGLVVEGGGAITGKVVNAGTISGERGIHMVGSAVTGGIHNQAGASINAGGFGIEIDQSSTVTGGVTNDGTIASAGGHGIFVDDDSRVVGDINNANEISAEWIGIFIYDRSTVEGNIINTGTISEVGVGPSGSNECGIYVGNASTVTGNIENSGTISGFYGGLAVDAGADGGSIVAGKVVNTGTISAEVAGLGVRGESDISGGVENSGTITGGDVGLAVATGGDISGGIINRADGTIAGVNQGLMVLLGSDISGGLVNSGTIEGVYGDGLVVAGDGDITGGVENSGTITGWGVGLEVTGGSDISGGLVNSGIIEGQSALVVTGASNISGGIDNRGIIRGTDGVALSLNDTSANVTAPQTQMVIDNSGQLIGRVTLGNAILNLTGDSSRVDGLVRGGDDSVVNVEGTFTAEDDFEVGSFAIAGGATFNTTHGHYIATVSGVSNTGTLAVAAGERVTIHGDYTQQAGGLLRTGATSSAAYGQLVVDGAADLSASNALDVRVTANDTLVDGDVLADVLAANALTVGEELTVTDNSALWKFTGVVDGNTIDLAVERGLSYVEAVGGSSRVPAAAAGAAGALDALQQAGASGDMQQVFNEMGTLATAEQVADAVGQNLPALTGDVARASLGRANKGGTRVVHDRLVRLSGLSAGDDQLKDRMLWVKTFYTDSEQDKRKGVYGYRADSFGIAMGGDAKINAQWRLGGAFSFARGDVKDDSPITDEKIDIDTYQGILYATRSLSDHLYLNLIAALGYNDIDSERHIVFGGLERTAEADYDSWHIHLDAELERRFQLTDKTSLTPSVRLRYSYIDVESYKESGAGALNLKVGSDDADALQANIGCRIGHALSDKVLLNGRLGIGYDFLADRSSLSASYVGGGPTFTTKGIDPAEFIFNGGLGIDYLTEGGATVTARYDLDGREDYLNHVLALSLRLPF